MEMIRSGTWLLDRLGNSQEDFFSLLKWLAFRSKSQKWLSFSETKPHALLLLFLHKNKSIGLDEKEGWVYSYVGYHYLLYLSVISATFLIGQVNGKWCRWTFSPDPYAENYPCSLVFILIIVLSRSLLLFKNVIWESGPASGPNRHW